MPPKTRSAKILHEEPVQASDDDLPACPLPLRQRISVGRGLPSQQATSTPTETASRGRGILNRKPGNTGQSVLEALESLVQEPVRPRRQAAREALRRLYHQYSSDDDEAAPLQDILNVANQGEEGSVVPDNSGDHSDEGDDEYLYELGDDVLSLIDEDKSNFSDDSEESSEDKKENDNQHVAPSGRVWHKVSEHHPRAAGRQPLRNIVRQRSGVRPGIHPNSPKEAFLLFCDELIDEAVRFTNLEARRVIARQSKDSMLSKKWKPIDREEMEAFMGLHILSGAFHSQQRSTESLWSTRDGLPVFRAAMSRERFILIKRFFRVDDRNRRDPQDPLSPVRDVWNTFLSQLKAFYVPEPHLTIDEQLLEFHGNVKFRMFIPSKPGKYGMKVIWLCEASSGYALSAVVYIGEATLTEEEKHDGVPVSEALTWKVVQPFLNQGNNITSDNWFTRPSLAQRLSEKNTSIVGTMRQNNRELPPEAKSVQGRQKKSAVYYTSQDQLLLSFWDKGRKPVLLLSTTHTSPSNAENGLPEIVEFYNSTKSGVDNMDHMVRFYSCRRKCCRWPYTFCCNIVDVALVNAYILLKKFPEGCIKNRFDFLLEVIRMNTQNHITWDDVHFTL